MMDLFSFVYRIYEKFNAEAHTYYWRVDSLSWHVLPRYAIVYQVTCNTM